MTLDEIVDAVRDGKRPEYDDLRYAICALHALSVFDRQVFMKLAEAEGSGKKPFMTTSAKWQWEEHFGRRQRAGAKPPKEYVGWNNDPDNPEFQKRRGIANKIMRKAAEQARSGEGE